MMLDWEFSRQENEQYVAMANDRYALDRDLLTVDNEVMIHRDSDVAGRILC